MIIVGLVLFAVAVAAAIVLIAQNHSDLVNLHVINQTWSMHLYWVLAIGLIVAAVGLLGLAMMRASAARARRNRQQRKVLAKENNRLASELDAERAERQRLSEPVTMNADSAPAHAAVEDDGGTPVPERHRFVRHHRTV
jgi:cell shape-determining protein MreC